MRTIAQRVTATEGAVHVEGRSAVNRRVGTFGRVLAIGGIGLSSAAVILLAVLALNSGGQLSAMERMTRRASRGSIVQLQDVLNRRIRRREEWAPGGYPRIGLDLLACASAFTMSARSCGSIKVCRKKIAPKSYWSIS